MKKMISIFMFVAFLLSLSACNKKPSSVSTTDTATEESILESTSSETADSVEEDLENEPTSTEESVPTSGQSSGEGATGSSQSTQPPKSTQAPSTSTKAPVTSTKAEQNQNQNQNQNQSQNQNSNQNSKNKISPTVIASRCTHNYLAPTCTSLLPCTICGELGDRYQGSKVGAGHSYFFGSKTCIVCGFEPKEFYELNLDLYATNQIVTFDVYLVTEEKDISIYPCVALYREVNNNWEPYSGLCELGEFFALEATPGEELVSNGVKHGRWDYMSNEILKTDPDALVETEFSNMRLIRRFKILIPEAGTYKVEVTDGPNNSKIPDFKHYYVTKSY